MKTAWDHYLEQQLADPDVCQVYEEEMKLFSHHKATKFLEVTLHRRD